VSDPLYCEDCDCPDFLMQVNGEDKFCWACRVELKSIDPAHTIPCAQCEYLEEGEPE
jgi:hypothetical protein